MRNIEDRPSEESVRSLVRLYEAYCADGALDGGLVAEAGPALRALREILDGELPKENDGKDGGTE